MTTPTDFPSTIPYDSHRQWKIDHAGKIDKSTAKVLIFFFASLAIVASILRLVFRIYHNRKVFAHDWLVVFGTITLIPLTAVTYAMIPRMYIIETVNSDATVILSAEELFSLLDTGKYTFTFAALSWTTMFAIKFSFLVFFRPLIRNMSIWLERFYWFSIVFCAISYVFFSVEPAILCPHIGLSAIKCYPNTDFSLNLGLSLVVCIMDIITDIMIVSFPIILLSMSRMHFMQKLSIAVFLSLSVVMAIIAIVRVAGGLHTSLRGDREYSIVWYHILTQVEASVAVLMGSISAFRTIFVNRDEEHSSRGFGLYRRLLSKLGISKKTASDDDIESNPSKEGQTQLPQANTNASLKTLKNFIRKFNKEPGATTLHSVTEVEVEDYHAYVRKEAGPKRSNPSSEYQLPPTPPYPGDEHSEIHLSSLGSDTLHSKASKQTSQLS